MARRPDANPILSREELAEFARRLALLSVPGVEGVYQTAHNDCRFDGKRLPPAAAIQQLVAAWKVAAKDAKEVIRPRAWKRQHEAIFGNAVW